MIRPFISSLGSSIRRVVVSLAWLPARRPIAIERMFLARRSASRLVSSSICEQHPPGLAAGVVLDVGDQHLLRLGHGQSREPLELLALHLLLALQLVRLAFEVALAVFEGPFAALDLAELDPGCLGVVERPLLKPGDLLAAGLEVGAVSLLSGRFGGVDRRDRAGG